MGPQMWVVIEPQAGTDETAAGLEAEARAGAEPEPLLDGEPAGGRTAVIKSHVQQSVRGCSSQETHAASF